MDQSKLPFFEFEEAIAEPAPDVYPNTFLVRANDLPILTSVEIDGLKGFDKVDIELQNLTILTGPNNSGKSTILQAIALAFECFRRCLDADSWKLRTTGRSVSEFEFLPVNQPKDLWFRQVWKPSKDKERYIRVGLNFSNGFKCTVRLRFLFGALNIGLETGDSPTDEATIKQIAASSPVLLPAMPGPSSHEDHLSLARVHRLLNIREPNRVLRNILLRLQEGGDHEALNFVGQVLERYFGVRMDSISFDEVRDLEIRAPFKENEYSLDVVSAGSGLNQILQLASIIAWRKPGIVLLDEPDAHLHSSVQAQLLDFIMELVERFKLQIILATHSKDLIGQAPLHSIIPVDRTRTKLTPLASLDHLLLEYQRQGSLSNVDLALLYQTKRCLFVEGGTDSRLLVRIAERLKMPLFVGREQLVPFEFSGIDKIKLLPELVKLFERLIGAKLTWGAIRDGDANLPEIRDKYVTIAKDNGFQFFHIWGRYSIENYLIDPKLLINAIKKKKATNLTEDSVRGLLEESVRSIEDEVSGTFVTRTQTSFRSFQLDPNPFDAGAVAATKYLRGLTTLEEKLAAYPGKKIFGVFVEKTQSLHGVNIRLDDIVAEITPENVDIEVKECLESLKQL